MILVSSNLKANQTGFKVIVFCNYLAFIFPKIILL